MLKMKYLFFTAFFAAASGFATEISTPFQDNVITIDQDKISAARLNEFAKNKIARRFYHGKPPEDQQQTFMLEMADSYIVQHLLAREAGVRKLAVDAGLVDGKLADFTEKYRQHPNWQQAKDYYLPMIKQLATQGSLADSLQRQIEEQATPSPALVRDYYRQHPEKFTQPPQVRASLILLAVEPSAGGFVWQATIDQAKNIVEKLDNGADFSTLAQLHSTDPSADFDGDMGFLHQGMTSDKAEAAMQKLEIGQYTQPIVLLDGVAVFKVTDRKPEQRHTFAEVEQRATKLANNSARAKAWQALITELRAKAKINIEQSKLVLP